MQTSEHAKKSGKSLPSAIQRTAEKKRKNISKKISLCFAIKIPTENHSEITFLFINLHLTIDN